MAVQDVPFDGLLLAPVGGLRVRGVSFRVAAPITSEDLIAGTEHGPDAEVGQAIDQSDGVLDVESVSRGPVLAASVE